MEAKLSRRLMIIPLWLLASSAYYLALLHKIPNAFKSLSFMDIIYNNYLLMPLLLLSAVFIFNFYKETKFRLLSFGLLIIFSFAGYGYWRYTCLTQMHQSNVLVNMLSQDSHNVVILASLDKGLLVIKLESTEARFITWNAIESIDYKNY